MAEQRSGAGADKLMNGNVFIAGGTNTPGTWKIHSPTGALLAFGNLHQPHSGGQAVALQDGNVWISGSNQALGIQRVGKFITTPAVS